jgi:hypothetical protein
MSEGAALVEVVSQSLWRFVSGGMYARDFLLQIR